MKWKMNEKLSVYWISEILRLEADGSINYVVLENEWFSDKMSEIFFVAEIISKKVHCIVFMDLTLLR